ncbi:hypothetical protein CB0940_00272 [Cercospora beticola]|uniref:Uncharacterized protein n=1 Tax=Cercospora beticola TaxID=122368 RepID=A0A2G5IC60_CERBT|nr:hypothetical protein CB0940_00272 [Cercospora beticola]PIB02330.1 hypothetical protein CB0940_00272 [Cercospora beticola]
MAHHFRTTHNNPLPVPPKPGGTTAAASSTTTLPSHHHNPFTYSHTHPHYTHPHYSYTHPSYTHHHHSHAPKPKHVHFDTDYRPSALSLKIKLGPRSNPTSEIKISVYFEEGKLPRVKVKTKRPKEQPHRKRKRTYVEEQDGRGKPW